MMYCKKSTVFFFLSLALAFSFLSCEKINERSARRAANQGVRLLKEQNPYAALPYLKEAATLNPRSSRIQYLLGRTHEMNKNVFNAISAYSKAIALNKQFDSALFALGKLYLAQKNYAKAAIELKNAFDIHPDNHLYSYHLGMALHKLKKYSQAETTFSKTIQNNQQFIHGFNSLVAVYLDQITKTEDEVVQSKIQEKAVSTLKKAIANNIANEQSYNLLGLLYQKRKQFALSIATFGKAKSINRFSFSAHFNLAATLDVWLEELLNQEKLEKNTTTKTDIRKKAYQKLLSALDAFKECRLLKSTDESLQAQVSEKIRLLEEMKQDWNSKKKKRRKR